MNQEQSERIITRIETAYNKKFPADAAVLWDEYLEEQDYGLCSEAVELMMQKGNTSFMPGLAAYRQEVSLVHRSRLSKEREKTQTSGCEQCRGLRFIIDESGAGVTSGHPCPVCYEEGHTRWMNKKYLLDAAVLEEELDGPKQAYEQAPAPQPSSIEPASADTADMWVKWITEGGEGDGPEQIRSS